MTALAVPDATPRCVGDAVAKIAEKNAGVLKATPTARTAAPMMSPAGDRSCRDYQADADRDEGCGAEDEGRHPSGTRAKAMRQTTTTPP